MPDIPIEIWLHIAHFIPPQMLKNLMSVNRVFFYAEMAERYKEISFFQMDDRMLRNVERLQSPLVRNCVRVLRLRPYFIQELLAGTPPNDGLVASLKSCFGLLENLTEYHLAWFELPFISNAAIDILRAPMLTSLFLQKLSIEASLPKLEILLSFEEKLPELKELIISVRRDRMGTGVDSEQTATQFRSLASFLNRNRTTLTHFSFSSSDALDSTPFFRSLLAFPLLAELSLSIPTSSPHLGTPSELARWMNRGCSASLQILTLKPLFIDDGHSQWQISFGNWMISFASHLVLPKLNDLRLPSGFFQPQIISFVVSHFAMFSTLTSLDLTGQSMTFPQVRTIIQTSSSPSLCPSSNTLRHLRILRLGPITLSPELVDLLAEILPELQELELRVKDVVPCKDEAPVYRSAWTTNTTEVALTRKTRNQSRGQIEQFFTAMKSRIYPQWTSLQHISVWKFNSKLQYQKEYVELLEGRVPPLVLKKELTLDKSRRRSEVGLSVQFGM